MARPPTIYHTTGLLQLIAVSDYKGQQPVGYFSLPLEIREMVMELVLAYGDVFLDKPRPKKPDHKPSRFKGALHRAIKTVSKHNDKHSKPTPIPQPPGFQLLATCKQICAEGHAVFYSSNIFFLPPGSIDHARNSLNALQLQHCKMIRVLGLDMSLKDLTPAVFEQAYQTMRSRYGNTLKARANFAQGRQWGILVAEQIKDIWKQRLCLAVTPSGGLISLKYRVAKNSENPDANVKDDDDLLGFLNSENDGIDWSPEIRNPVWYTAMLVREHVEEIVRNEGWKALRKQVIKGDVEWPDWYA